jgi:protein SCO1/2
MSLTTIFIVLKKPIDNSYRLISQNGQPVSLDSWHGKIIILFFGYTECPDICPTTLHTIASALNNLTESERNQFQSLFVTLDPNRDTPEVLTSYTAMYNSNIIGLTGSTKDIEHMASNFDIYFEKVVDDASKPNEYSMDHDSVIFILGKDGKLLDKILPTMSTTLLTHQLKEYLNK